MAPGENAVTKASFAPLFVARRKPEVSKVGKLVTDAVTPLMKHVGYGEGYRYVHEDPEAQEEMECLPESLRGRDYVKDK